MRRLLKPLFILAGLAFLGLAALGLFLPVLPTVPFLLVAGACFARSSMRLNGWLRRHARFGPLIRRWQDHGQVPRPIKRRATLVILVTAPLALLLSRPPLWVWGLLALALAVAFAFLWSRPEPAAPLDV